MLHMEFNELATVPEAVSRLPSIHISIAHQSSTQHVPSPYDNVVARELNRMRFLCLVAQSPPPQRKRIDNDNVRGRG